MEKRRPKSLGDRVEGWMLWIPEDRIAVKEKAAEYMVGGKVVRVELDGLDSAQWSIAVDEGLIGNYSVHAQCKKGLPRLRVRNRKASVLPTALREVDLGDEAFKKEYAAYADDECGRGFIDEGVRARLIELRGTISVVTVEDGEICIGTSRSLSRTNMAHMQNLANVINLARELVDKADSYGHCEGKVR